MTLQTVRDLLGGIGIKANLSVRSDNKRSWEVTVAQDDDDAGKVYEVFHHERSQYLGD